MPEAQDAGKSMRQLTSPLLEGDSLPSVSVGSPERCFVETEPLHSAEDTWFTRGLALEKSGDSSAAMRLYQRGADLHHVRCILVSIFV